VPLAAGRRARRGERRDVAFVVGDRAAVKALRGGS
jgi:hypothetical protein